MIKKWHLVMLGYLFTGPVQAQVDLDAFLKQNAFDDLEISPTGEYYAATLPREDSTGLLILRRSDNKITATFSAGRNGHVDQFFWVGDHRVVLSINQKLGTVDTPYSTGELFSLDAGNGRSDILVGYRTNSHMTSKSAEQNVYARLTDLLPVDADNVLVSITPFSDKPVTSTIERLDTSNGRRVSLGRSPVTRAGFLADNHGQVRFSAGADSDNAIKLYYRGARGEDWRLLNDENQSGHIESPIGFSEDDAIAYLQVENPTGPDSIVAWDIAADTRREVFRDPTADPGRIITRLNSNVPIGVMVFSDRAHTRFFDENSADARLYRGLEAAFGGAAVRVTSATRDGRQLLVQVWSDSDPGQFYLFDTQTRRAEHVLSRRDWVQPRTAATVQAVSLKARDGLALQGFVTRPRGSEGRALPMVVLPHGGPFGISDSWGYDIEAQILAAAGYAVLQVNYRGSGNYGRAFHHAGARQWGGTMQDDLTDATRWAVAQGYADGARICIYGASYGGYAALMGVAKEPTLYRCAAGYVGVYDLPMMYSRGDTQMSRSGTTFLHDWLGEQDALAKVSPVNLAGQIKVPVFLAAGGDDERAPIAHTRKMAAALEKAGVPVQTLYYPSESHGFYTLEHRREYYTRLLAFLAASLGGQQAAASPAQP